MPTAIPLQGEGTRLPVSPLASRVLVIRRTDETLDTQRLQVVRFLSLLLLFGVTAVAVGRDSFLDSLAGVLRGASAPHEMHDQANDGHNEEQVNQPARDVECEKAQEPSHQ